MLLPAHWKMLTVQKTTALMPVACWKNMRPNVIDAKRFQDRPFHQIFETNRPVDAGRFLVMVFHPRHFRVNVSIPMTSSYSLRFFSIWNFSRLFYFPRSSWSALRPSSSWPWVSSQIGVSGIAHVHKRKMQGRTVKMKASTCHSTKAPMMYATQIPRANDEAVIDPNRPLILGDEHSLTLFINQIIDGC